MASLSERVRAATWSLHARAASSGFLGDLCAGRRPLDDLALLTRQYREIYAALEDPRARFGRPASPNIVENRSPFARPELLRGPALDRDIAALGAADLPILASTRRYIHRVREVADDAPALLGQHYVRYLGDLSGGLMIGAALERVFELGPDTGTAFYHFDQIPDPSEYRRSYRAAIDATGFDAAAAARLIAEAELAYRLNADLLDELAKQPASP